MAWADLTGAALFAALPTPAIVFAADGTVVAANQGAADLGLTTDDGAEAWQFVGGGRFGDPVFSSRLAL